MSTWLDHVDSWSLAKKPVIPHSWDEEFEGDLSNWTEGTASSGTAIDTYAAFATGGWRKSVNDLRPSWLMVQPPTDTSCQLTRAVTLPDNIIIYWRCHMPRRAAGTSSVADDGGVSIRLIHTGEGATDYLQMNTKTFNGSATVLMEKRENNAYSAPITGIATAGEYQDWEYYALHKRGTTWDGWASAGGSWRWLTRTTHAGQALNTVQIVISNKSTNNPGNLIMGLDFIRFVETATFFV